MVSANALRICPRRAYAFSPRTAHTDRAASAIGEHKRHVVPPLEEEAKRPRRFLARCDVEPRVILFLREPPLDAPHIVVSIDGSVRFLHGVPPSTGVRGAKRINALRAPKLEIDRLWRRIAGAKLQLI